MSDASELYQSVILDHNRAPRNYHTMDQFDRTAEGYNPLCGDQFTVWLKLEGDTISDVSFQGSGCAISKASASLMTMMVKGKTVAEAEQYFDGFRDMVTGKVENVAELPKRLAVFAGVREFPSRVKCATLGWHALKTALGNTAT